MPTRIKEFMSSLPQVTFIWENKLGMTQDAVVKSAFEGVKLAKTFCDNVEFSPEDASRTDRNFLSKLSMQQLQQEQQPLISRYVGYSIPFEYGDLLNT
ncbi:MAG: hypothetical protein Ct9H300mP4_10250 [Gammaproteobacteria bacterium]|nr:MAG: hypothetical protein Ct9H300mP4_10250 [Gammaproteobacteria bacterium]